MKHTGGTESEAGAPEHARAVGRKVRLLLVDLLSTAPPILKSRLFLDRIERLATLIAVWGQRVNLTAAPQDPREIGFHVMDSVAPIMLSNDDEQLCRAFVSRSRVLDLGSGAGFPGLVLASASSASLTLLESRRKRASFLAIAAAEMDLANVTVKQQRLTGGADRWKWSGSGVLGTLPVTAIETEAAYDVVTARAFGTAPAFHSAAASLLRPGGLAILYASPGQDVAEQVAEKNGLHDFQQAIYTVTRENHKVERVLALWRRD